MILLRCMERYPSKQIPTICARFISLNTSNNLIQKWRVERGLPLNPNVNGVLADGQDYSYQDGRPTPYGVGQIKRISKQRELAESIMRLTQEVDFAVERHRKLKQAEERYRQRIMNSKLKPKGAALLNAKNEQRK